MAQHGKDRGRRTHLDRAHDLGQVHSFPVRLFDDDNQFAEAAQDVVHHAFPFLDVEALETVPPVLPLSQMCAAA